VNNCQCDVVGRAEDLCQECLVEFYDWLDSKKSSEEDSDCA
jgi:DNA-directed RNA polymerase specialized sigma24 family protein